MRVEHKGNDKLFPFLRAIHFPGFLADAGGESDDMASPLVELFRAAVAETAVVSG